MGPRVDHTVQYTLSPSSLRVRVLLGFKYVRKGAGRSDQPRRLW
ncbi:uncharacterized protein G2W53_001598 [Senna tora]|uniref:Uncharacterized protein n=1 Tax=Senna tora TaxID=362788 RepID=A0A834XK04_9FABA|nr:uncharacterized protein G2W53_001598 [Senna tora]